MTTPAGRPNLDAGWRLAAGGWRLEVGVNVVGGVGELFRRECAHRWCALAVSFAATRPSRTTPSREPGSHQARHGRVAQVEAAMQRVPTTGAEIDVGGDQLVPRSGDTSVRFTGAE